MVDVVVPEFNPVNEDLAIIVIKPLEKIKESGFATARWTYES